MTVRQTDRQTAFQLYIVYIVEDRMNDKSTTPISEGLKEKKLKAPNAETAFVSDL